MFKKIKINKFLERQNVIIDPTITGMRLYSFSKRFSIAKSAALELAMSKIVSTWRISAPPSNSALAWVVYGSTSLSKAMNTKVMLCKLIVKTGVNVRLLTWQIVTYDSKKWKWFFLLMLRKSGRSTNGEMDKVRFIGPKTPATQHCLPVFFSGSATTRAAVVSLCDPSTDESIDFNNIRSRHNCLQPLSMSLR